MNNFRHIFGTNNVRELNKWVFLLNRIGQGHGGFMTSFLLLLFKNLPYRFA